MNIWKVLEVNNLPPDILTGDYEFSHGPEKEKYTPRKPAIQIVRQLIGDMSVIHKDIYYRRKQKPAPTHEEIMTKWWKRPGGVSWFRVIVYAPRTHDYYRPNPDGDDGWHTKKEFTNFESADMPPEE